MSKNNFMRRVGAGIVGTLCATTVVHAAVIEEILVTAQKRTENAQDVPIAVSVIGGDAIEALGMASGSDVGNQVPNLQVQRPYGDVQPIFSVRGISMTDFKATQASPIGVYVDEVFLGVPFTHGMQMFDLERVEVLRGPQGTLFGKNTTGGAISVTSKAPSAQREGYATIGFGNFNRIDVKAGYQTGLVDDVLAMRVAINSSKADGHFESQLPGVPDPDSVDHWSARLSLSYQPTENIDAVLRITTARQDANAPTITPGGTNIGGYSHVGSAFNSFANRVAPQTTDFDLASLSVNWQLGDWTITSITASGSGDYLNQTDADGSPLEIINIDWGTSFDQFSEDLRASAEFEDLTVIAGVYYADEDIAGNNHYVFGTDRPDAFNGIAIDSNLKLKRESIAAYGQASYDVTDALSLTFGLRYSSDEHTLSDFTVDWLDAATGGPSPVAVFVFGASQTVNLASKSFEDKEVSGKLGIDYRLGEDALVYASYSRGYRSGAFNTGALFQNEVDKVLEPEFVDSYELGFKSQFWDGQAQLNSAIFYYDYQDQQFVNVVGISQLLTSAEKADILGAEIELLVRPTDQLTVQAGLGLLDTEYKEAELLVALDPFGATSRTEDLSGNKLVAAPDVNFNLAVDYEVPIGDASLTFHIDTVYTSEQFFSAFNDFFDPTTVGADYRGIREDSYWMTNGRVSYRSPEERFGIALWVKNIEDKEVIGYAINAQSYGGFDYTQYLKPRTFGVEASYRF